MTKLDSKLIECDLCGYTSYDPTNFEDGICLACCRIHEIDY